jgi:hypothetical protein
VADGVDAIEGEGVVAGTVLVVVPVADGLGVPDGVLEGPAGGCDVGGVIRGIDGVGRTVNVAADPGFGVADAEPGCVGRGVRLGGGVGVREGVAVAIAEFGGLASRGWVGLGVVDTPSVGVASVAVGERVGVPTTSVAKGVDVAEAAATGVGVPVATTLGALTAVGDTGGTAGEAVPIGVCDTRGVGVRLT